MQFLALLGLWKGRKVMGMGGRSSLMNLESGVKAVWVTMPNVAHRELFQVSQGSPEKTPSLIRASCVSPLLSKSPHPSSHASWAESFEIGSCPANLPNVHSCPQETLSTFRVLQTLEAQAASLLSLPFYVAPGGLWPFNISRVEIGTTHQVLQIPGVHVNLSESILKPLSLEWKRGKDKRRLQHYANPLWRSSHYCSPSPLPVSCIQTEVAWWWIINEMNQAGLALHLQHSAQASTPLRRCVSTSILPTPRSPARTDHSLLSAPAASWTSFMMSPIILYKS